MYIDLLYDYNYDNLLLKLLMFIRELYNYHLLNVFFSIIKRI